MLSKAILPLVAALLALPPCAAARAGPPLNRGHTLLARAVRAVRQQERAVRNIRYDSVYEAMAPRRGKKGLFFSEQLYAHSTFDGLPRGRFRIAVLRDLNVWRNGPAPYSVSTYAIAYNGIVGTYLQTASGSSKRVFGVSWGKVSGHLQRMVPLVMYSAVGWNASLFGFTSTNPGDDHARFSTFINPKQKRVLLAPGTPGAGLRLPALSASWEVVGGKRYLRVVREGNHLINVFLLDPKHGFSIARFRFLPWAFRKAATGWIAMPGRWVAGGFSVKAFYEPIPGVFFPRVAHFKGFGKVGGKRTVVSAWSVRFTKVAVNLPHVTKKTYVIAFPRGTTVHDTATGQVIRVGGTPEQQLKEIEAAVKAAK